MQRALRGAEPHPDLAEAINDLALLLEEHGDYDESGALYLEAIAMKRRLLGEKHPEIARGSTTSPLALQDKGDLVRSERPIARLLPCQRELLGETHPDVANTLNNLAFVQYDRGDTRGALATERESLAVYRKMFPNDHPEVARIMNRIGFWLTEAGEYAEAERDLQASLSMRRRLLGDAHPDVATSLITWRYSKLRSASMARHWFRRAAQSAFCRPRCRRRTGRRRSARARKVRPSPALACMRKRSRSWFSVLASSARMGARRPHISASRSDIWVSSTPGKAIPKVGARTAGHGRDSPASLAAFDST